jgi:hypothetical protein
VLQQQLPCWLCMSWGMPFEPDEMIKVSREVKARILYYWSHNGYWPQLTEARPDGEMMRTGVLRKVSFSEVEEPQAISDLVGWAD